MGFIVCIVCLNTLYRRIVSDPIQSSFYQTSSIMMPIPKLDGSFTGLKWSAVRHGFAALISAALIYFVFASQASICRVILFLNLLYAVLVFQRYFTRKKMVLEIHQERPLPAFIKNLIRPTGIVCIYCCYLMVLLYTVYGLRP